MPRNLRSILKLQEVVAICLMISEAEKSFNKHCFQIATRQTLCSSELLLLKQQNTGDVWLSQNAARQ